MQKFMAWIQAVLIPTLGAPGLFIVAFLDSSFLSIPEISDLLVITAALDNPRTAWVAILMATLGSLGGCLVLYWIGRRGEEAVLVRRFGEERTRRAREAFQRWDVLALAVPAVLPPPMPFKIFVLAAGVFEFKLAHFVATLVLARGLRYGLWAIIGIVYRERALDFLRQVDGWGAQRLPLVLGALGLALLLGALLVIWRRRRQREQVVEEAQEVTAAP
jgi:membrane protein YqaA with SNARE-associated domain